MLWNFRYGGERSTGKKSEEISCPHSSLCYGCAAFRSPERAWKMFLTERVFGIVLRVRPI
jgi:hypothetical protein